MRTYNQAHAYYCGIDRHARSLYVHVLDDTGTTRRERDVPASPTAVLDALSPYREGLVVGCECMFAWYGLAGLCERQRIPFVLGHVLAMKLIHGGKAKNDRLGPRIPAARLPRTGGAPRPLSPTPTPARTFPVRLTDLAQDAFVWTGQDRLRLRETKLMAHSPQIAEKALGSGDSR